MKLLAVADTHFGFNLGRTATARKKTADAMFQSFKNIVHEAKRLKVDAIIHCGDVFNRSNPPDIEVKRVYRAIEDILDANIGFIVVPGNHDRAHLPESLYMHYSDNFHQFNKLGTFKFEGINFIGFPFEYRNPKAVFNKAIEKIKSQPNQQYFIMCHQLFYGAEFGPHRFRFTVQDDVIQPKNLPHNLLAVISGHIHRAQVLGGGKVFYTGSTERTDFVEAIEDKVMLYIDTEKELFEYRNLETTPCYVHELEISDKAINSFDLEGIIDPLERTLIRFIGRPMTEEEITQLYIKFPAKEFPLLYFSPKRPFQELKALYGQELWLRLPNISVVK